TRGKRPKQRVAQAGGRAEGHSEAVTVAARCPPVHENRPQPCACASRDIPARTWRPWLGFMPPRTPERGHRRTLPGRRPCAILLLATHAPNSPTRPLGVARARTVKGSEGGFALLVLAVVPRGVDAAAPTARVRGVPGAHHRRGPAPAWDRCRSGDGGAHPEQAAHQGPGQAG